ncbi:iron dependent repressor, metal binding and dimerization domain protein [Lutimonas sp.]|uniref:metal-dependent transcriptional regulator n=1 Tax=Lutimonas sp. TaxID=1872403 RepID=UPI003D9B0BEA
MIFIGLVILIFAFFRPVKGWYWLIKNNYQSNEKTVIEDILKQLYRLETYGSETDISLLTNSLKFKDAVIIDALHKMSVMELVKVEGDLIQLTAEGRQYALKIIRVHRLWEKYLAEKTGFDKTDWHDMAEEMEHVLSHEETDLLANQLGNPMYDPHGDPIPNKSGMLKEIIGEPLSSMEAETVGRIVHIEDEPDVIYRQILAEKIHIGSVIRVEERSNERIVFHSEGEEFVLAPIVAANITVSPLKKEVEIEEGTVRLSSLKDEEVGIIVGMSKECRGENRRRLLDLGFVNGSEIKIDLNSPLKNPVAYSIKGTSIALRNDQASKILINKV